MIFDDLVTTIKAMQDLQKKTAIKNNKAMQDNADIKYRLLLTQVNQFVDVIMYLYTDLNVPKNHEILMSTSELMNVLEQIVVSGLASPDGIINAGNTFKTLQSSMKKEWSRQYVDLTGATVSTLEAIREIDPDNVGSCLQKIQPAENWDLDVERYKIMHNGLNEADHLIMELGLDDEIITFLQNTNSARATLQDLNDRVLAWIRAEHLEKKIRISFMKAK
jgi:hypothetical protein